MNNSHLPPHLALPSHLAAQAARGPALLRDALEIWWAGVTATLPETIFARETSTDGHWLRLADYEIDLRGVRRLVVVGAGKASAAMAAAFYRHCLQQIEGRIAITGWINAPEGSYQPGSAGPIHLHAARPAGLNEPTAQAVAGTHEIMRLVADCGPDDLCVVLISGGGSAILTSPIEGLTLLDKQHVARLVAAAGANIVQLNTVRRALSRVKGGGLARACRAGQLVTLIISDVLGDPLETIASGPALPSAITTPQQALNVLKELGLLASQPLANVVRILQQRAAQRPPAAGRQIADEHVAHIVLANNATAVDAAGVKAVELGYRYIMQAARQLEGDVSALAVKAADTIQQLAHQPQIDCWISGGEPTVQLPRHHCGRGGRNQQLMLLTMLELMDRGWPGDHASFPQPLLALSAGTDGEDGPTTAAGAWFDGSLVKRLVHAGLNPGDYAARADAWSLFQAVDGLIESAPTGTNVCDLRIAIKSRAGSAQHPAGEHR